MWKDWVSLIEWKQEKELEPTLFEGRIILGKKGILFLSKYKKSP